MKPYSVDLRQRVVQAVETAQGSIRQIARRFCVGQSSVTRWLAQWRETGSLKPKDHAGGQPPAFDEQSLARLEQLLKDHPDATLDELQVLGGFECSRTAIWRAIEELRISGKKKTLKASEQDDPEVKRKRQQLQKDIARIPMDKRIDVDETGATTNMARRYGRAPLGQRVYGSVPSGYKNVTSICGLRLSGVVAAMAFEGGTDQCAFRTFVQECLVPGIQKGDIIIWDNLRVYQDTQFIEWIEQAGARVMPLPPYSPDFNPIEEMFSKVKGILRKLAQRTTGTLYEGFAQALQCVTLNNIVGWCQHRELCSTQA